MHACMLGAQLAFSTLAQSRAENQGMVLLTFSLGVPVSIKAPTTVPSTTPSPQACPQANLI